MKKHKENFLISLALNIFVPVIILIRFSGEDMLGPTLGLIVALLFPIGYGIYDFTRRKKFNFISALGIANVLLTGGIGLLRLDPEFIASRKLVFLSLSVSQS